MRRTVFLSLLVLAMGSFAGQSAMAVTITVTATDSLTFSPSAVTINIGDTIMWEGLSSGQVNHNVVEESEALWNNSSFNPLAGGESSGAAGSTDTFSVTQFSIRIRIDHLNHLTPRIRVYQQASVHPLIQDLERGG